MIVSVHEGRPGTAMTAWKSQLNDAQIEAVVDFVRTAFMGSNDAANGAPAAHPSVTKSAASPLPNAALAMPDGLTGNAAQGRRFCRSGDSPPSDLRNIVEIPNRHQHQTESRRTRHELDRHVYNFRYYFCHGYSGNALTVANSFLDPKRGDFTRTDPNQLGRDRMLDAVTRGRPNTAMKAFAGLLTQDELRTSSIVCAKSS